jgi:hypothetical protein
MRHCGVALALALGCGPAVDSGGSGGTSSTSMSDPSTSSTSTTSTSTTSSTGESSSGASVDLGEWPPGFIMDPDGESVSIECSVWDQDCPPGEKCMPWANDGGNAWIATRCSPIAPDPRQPGEPCTVQGSGVSGLDDCDVASMCWDVDPETNVGECVAFCMGSENNPICAEPGHQCTINSDGTLILCIPTCNPLAQDCLVDEGCYDAGDAFRCVPDASGEMGVAGDPCEYPNVCDPGLYCALPEHGPGCASSGCCSHYCDVQTPACLDGQECLPYFGEGEAPPGYENVGVCGVAR